MGLTEEWVDTPDPDDRRRLMDEEVAALFARSHVGPAPAAARRARVYAGLEALRAATGDDRLFARAAVTLVQDLLLDALPASIGKPVWEQATREDGAALLRGLRATDAPEVPVILAAALRWALESEP